LQHGGEDRPGARWGADSQGAFVSTDRSAFVDYVPLSVKAGDGGHGCMSFRREKHVPRGGPDGGDGGKGGDIWLEAHPELTTLIDVKMKSHVVAGRGMHGLGKNMSGKGGEDQVIAVPLGTMVSTEDGEHLADLTEPGQRFLAAAGGRGGAGNQHFASSTNRAPRHHTSGVPGEERRLILELKLIADVGLVGLPNAGKSTLLAHLTHATPKIAAYPFTTLHPNLGVFELPGPSPEEGGEDRTIVIADIPGLVEGASKGVGLGHRFLRHIERTRMLVHLIPADPSVMEDLEASELNEENVENVEIAAGLAVDAYEMVRAELLSYSAEIGHKPEIIVLSKTDLLPENVRAAYVKELERAGLKAIPVSAESEEGLQALKLEIARQLEELDAREAADAESAAELAKENEF
jgi:GTP-binding protein